MKRWKRKDFFGEEMSLRKNRRKEKEKMENK